jgi:hypothetical protein
MLILAIYSLVYRWVKERHFNFFVVIHILMILCLSCKHFKHLVIVAFSLNSNLLLLNYFSLYFYDIYFATIVFQLALKLIDHHKINPKHLKYKNVAKAIFIVFLILISIGLIYSCVFGD